MTPDSKNKSAGNGSLTTFATKNFPVVGQGIVEGAADFAKKLGFSAPAELPEALKIFGDEPPAPVPFPFGKNGKPHYEQQPGDDEDFAESVLAKLRKSRGENGFTFELAEAGEEWIDDGGVDDAAGAADEE